MSQSSEVAVLARVGFRLPAQAAGELPEAWRADPRWARLLTRIGDVADPDAALRRLNLLGQPAVDAVLEAGDRARPLLGVLGFSEHLSAILSRLPETALALLGRRVPSPQDLRELKDRGVVRIAAADLASPPTIETFVEAGRALSSLADEVVAGALEQVGAPPGLAVMAMGKWGGGELNYSSDIDLLFVTGDGDVAEAERAARAFMELMNGPPALFRTDADLRPEGRDGPLVRSLPAFRAYYERWAEVWEFQALIKCRFAGGDGGVGERFLEMATPFVWPERLDPAAVEQVRELKARAEQEVHRKGRADREVKLGPGGIRDVEFAVQLLQLVHGRHRPELRVRNTLDALGVLGAEGFVAEADAAEFRQAYAFLRHAEHRLQLVHGRQTHTLPRRASDIEHLARGLGYRSTRETGVIDAFEADWRQTTGAVRTIHEKLFYRPLLEAFGVVPPLGTVLAPEEGAARVYALGFDRPPVVQESVTSLTAGASRRAKVMRAILPGLLSWLAETPDPDAGIVRLRELMPALEALPHLLATLRDSPPVAELLCRALGTGPVLAELLSRDASLVSVLGTPARDDRDALMHEASALVGRARETADAIAHLRRFKESEWLRGALADLVAGTAGAFVETSRAHAFLGDACLEGAIAIASREADHRHGGPPPDSTFAVVAMGRYGGYELSHASDLDVMFVYGSDARCPDGTEGRLYHAYVAERVVDLLADSPPIFRVDTELRPEGRNGPIVRSLESYRQYYDRWADTWEFQALTRARHAAGDPEITAALLEHVRPRVWPDDLPSAQVQEIRRMKARIERERVKTREDRRSQVKLGTGGLADVEFTVQLLQMRHGHADPAIRTPNTLAAIRALSSASLVGDPDRAWLEDAYLILNRVRNHLFLLRGLPTDSLPSRDEDLERLSRSLGYGRRARSAFLEDYRRTTRRTRQVCDRLFYGED